MSGLFAYAEAVDTSDGNMVMVLGGMGILAGTAAAVFVLIYICRRRGHVSSDAIVTGAIFWGLIAAGSLLYAMQSQMKWSKEYLVRIESGYVDPNDLSDAPKLPWGIWSVMGAAYVGMLGWAGWGKGRVRR